MWTYQTDHRWIVAACRQLSRVTGWPTLFAPIGATTATETLPTDYAWSCDLSNGDEAIGTLRVPLPSGRPLDQSFLQACESADLTAQLIQRVLHEQTHSRRPSSVASPTGTADTPANDRKRAVRRVLDVSLRLTGFRAAALFLLDPQDGCLKLQSERTCDGQTLLLYDRSLSEAPFDAQALRDGSVTVRRDDQRVSEWLPDGMSMGICRAINTPQGTQGTLWMFDRRDRRLVPREEQVLDSVVLRLSDLLEQAVLIEESVLQRQLRAELRIASESQPERLVDLDTGWCQVAGRMESAREVGGDLCEVLPLDNDRLLIAIGDAAGHSIPAAMVMATMRGALRAIVDEGRTFVVRADRILARMNRVLHGIVDSHQFMSLTCAIIDGRTGTLSLANAGHPPVLLLREGEVVPLESSGMLLGVIREAKYTVRRISLQADDLLAFYSDGISEAPNDQRIPFHSDGIAEVMTRHSTLGPSAIVERTWNAFEAHLAEGHTDDRTLMVARFSGTQQDEPMFNSEQSHSESLVDLLPSLG